MQKRKIEDFFSLPPVFKNCDADITLVREYISIINVKSVGFVDS